METTTLAGGCFWCLEAAYERIRGVETIVSGYAGGHVTDPSYQDVCTGNTGHAEVVRVTFDPEVVSFRDILRVFFTVHDPTTLNRQGADVGTQYRSAIYVHSPEQEETATAVIEELAGLWKDPIVTELAPAGDFYEAEEYHHQYYRRNASAGYCQFVIEPKLAKLRKELQSLLAA